MGYNPTPNVIGRHNSALTAAMRPKGQRIDNAGPLQAAAGCAAQRRAGTDWAPRLSLLYLGVTDRQQ